MYNVKLYNKISKVGLDDLDPAKYTCSEDFTDYNAVLVRSAKLHDVEFPKNLRCIARAGAGVNNIPIDRCSEEGIVVSVSYTHLPIIVVKKFSSCMMETLRKRNRCGKYRSLMHR